jgi:hypothetical protein
MVTARAVTTTGADSGIVQPRFVVVTVKVPGSVTTIDCVVAPLDQSHDVPALAVSVALLPGPHSARESLVVMLETPVVMTAGSESCESQAPIRTRTVYDPGSVTTIDCVVAPVDQVQASAAGAVRVTLPPAGQSSVPVAATVGVGGIAPYVTLTDEVVAHPFGVVTVSVYVQAEVT